MVVLFKKGLLNGKFREIARTEGLKNTLNPEFARKIVVDFYFEEHQKLKFEVYEVKSDRLQLSAPDFLGLMECSLGEIVGASGGKLKKPMTGKSVRSGRITEKNCGEIQVMAEELKEDPREDAFIQLRASLQLDKEGGPHFFLIFRINDDNSETWVDRSEPSVWGRFEVTLQELCNSDKEKSANKNAVHNPCMLFQEFLGFSEYTESIAIIMTYLMKGEKQATMFICCMLINPKKTAKGPCACCKYKNSGVLEVMQCQVRPSCYTFLDYILGTESIFRRACRTELNFAVAVDFTASNGDPLKPFSLHYINPGTANQYQMALRAVGDIIADYSSDKQFPAFGFGAIPPHDRKVSHKFHMNFGSNPTCTGVDGLLDAYQNSISKVRLCGPTNFSPVIREVADIAASSGCDGTQYFILLIITNGIINDFDETSKAIVEAAVLPMSIIIVGVGDADFEAMDAFNVDDSYMWKSVKRDRVQFVKFRDFVHGKDSAVSQAGLAKEVLFKVPDQLTLWINFYGKKRA